MASIDTMTRTEIVPGSDITISQIGFGTTMMGGLGMAEPMPTEESAAILRHALERGVNYLDSALLYGGGEALETLGVAIGDHPPKDLVISFKVGRVLSKGQFARHPRGKQEHVDELYASKPKYFFDYSRQGMRDAFAQSMEHLNAKRTKLGMKKLEPEDLNIVVYVHDPDVRVHGQENQSTVMEQVMEESFPELYKMQKEGKIKAYGIGTNETGTCIQALKDPNIKLLMLAGRGTLLCNEAPNAPKQIQDDSRWLPYLATKIKQHPNAAKLIIASPGNSSLGYGGNTYNYGPASDEVIAFRDRVQAAMTNDSGLTMPDLVVRYPFDFFGDSVAAVISGPASEAQVDSTIASYHAQVPPVVWEKLRAYSLLNPRLLRGDEVVRDGTMRT